MPSLHAGITFLIAIYGIQRLRSPWRWLLALYPLAMSTALVYYAEHYVDRHPRGRRCWRSSCWSAASSGRTAGTAPRSRDRSTERRI